jgi:hypothetical protein
MFTILMIAGVFLLAMHLVSAFAYEAFHGPSELIHYEKDKAYDGYTLFTHTYTFLIDMEGNVVNMWKIPEGYAIEKTARLLENGNLLQAIRPPEGKPPMGGGTGVVGSVFQELDWDGNILWEFQDPRPNYVAHHNFKRIFNKKLNAYTTIMVATRGTGDSIFVSEEEAVAKGCDPSGSNEEGRPDAIVEVDMDGNIVWEWWSFDHVIQDRNPDWPNYGIIAANPGKIDLNWGKGVQGDFIHANSLDYNEELDQIVVNASVLSEFWIIDHGGTFIPGDPEGSIALAAGPKGDILYRWGNPNVFDHGEEPSSCEGQSSEGHQQVHFSHDIQWIKPGLPGAGHFIVFDNGARRSGITRSALVEVNPYDGPPENGDYIPQMEAGYDERGRSKQIVWIFKSKEVNSFYSQHISGCQRLPNGNTLACTGRHGHFFEVTGDGEVVWEYINPIAGGRGFDKGSPYKVLKDGQFNWVFTCHRYGPDFSGLKGKDLTPKGPITEFLSNA